MRSNGLCEKFDLKHNKKVYYSFKNKNSKTKSKSWWDSDCQDAINLRKKCYICL